MQPPWSQYGQYKNVTFWWEAYAPQITLSDLNTGTHRLKNIWHDNTGSSCSLAKHIHASSIKHNNVLLSNEFSEKGQILCMPHRNNCVSGPFMHKALQVNAIWNQHHFHLAVVSFQGKAGYGFARVNGELCRLFGLIIFNHRSRHTGTWSTSWGMGTTLPKYWLQLPAITGSHISHNY